MNLCLCLGRIRSVPDCDIAWVVLPSVSLKFIRFTLVNMQIELPLQLWHKWETDLLLIDVRSQWKRIVNIRTQFLQIKLRSFYIPFINRATITNVWKYHFSFEPMLCSFCRVEVCCDTGQNDTIGKIELNPLSSCQVIILIARMTFNCFSSCLMS